MNALLSFIVKPPNFAKLRIIMLRISETGMDFAHTQVYRLITYKLSDSFKKRGLAIW